MHQQHLILHVHSTTLTVSCSLCQTPSSRVHCYYTRTVQDLSWTTLHVQIILHVRRFVCTNTECSRWTFAERLGEQIQAYARRTTRCNTQLQAIGLALGGKAGVRLAQKVGLSVSADPLLRLSRSTEVPKRATPNVLGVDDFGATRSYRCSCKDSGKEALTWGSAPSALPG